MNNLIKWVLISAVVFICLPGIVFASAVKTISGTITKIDGSQLIISTGSAAVYAAEVGNAQMARKNGVAMQFSEFMVGDKVLVKGSLWADNSISASFVQDNSLYAHTGTFSGKITAISPGDLSFTLQSKDHGTQTILTNSFSSFSKNGSNAGFGDLGLGMTATVKGVWDRSAAKVTASSIAETFRLIDIYFTGTLSMKNGSSFTVIGNGNVIYGVDASKAVLENKGAQPATINQFILGDSLRVWGKHVSGSVQIIGTKVKDSSR